jgi:hypothetical protein
MEEGKLPVRYLGVPLVSSKLSAMDCRVLIEKITSRIGSWTSRQLSFAGRLQLISSVLYGLQVYWTSIFILPKSVLKDISQKFNRFLWNGKDCDSTKAKVAWGDICFPKSEGGLGLKCVETWNISSMMRHIWSLFAKSGSIWVAWTHMYLLKGRSFWNVKLPQDCSWNWKKLLRIRNRARGFLKFEVGDGHGIHLWHDDWHPCGPLLDGFDFRVIYDSQSSIDVKVASVLKNGEWHWKPARSEELVTIQSRLPKINLGDSDNPVWTVSRKRIYVSSDTWNALRKKKPEVIGSLMQSLRAFPMVYVFFNLE